MYDKEQMIELVEQYQQYLEVWKDAMSDYTFYPLLSPKPIQRFGFREWLFLTEEDNSEYYIIYGKREEKRV